MTFQEKADILEGGKPIISVDEGYINPSTAMPPGIKVTDYSGSATAGTDFVKKDLTIGSASGSYIALGPMAWINDNDGNLLTGSATAIAITKNDQFSKYSEHAKATQNSVQVSANIDKAKGNSIYTISEAFNENGNTLTRFLLDTGSIGGYNDAALADSKSASSVQMIDSLTGKSVSINPSAENIKGDSATDGADIRGGSISVIGYANYAKITEASAVSSQAFNSATAKNIVVGSQASNSLGESSSVLSTVIGGSIKPYFDRSETYYYPIATVTSSAGMNAVGTINVQSNAKNAIQSTSYLPPNFKTSGKGKLTASVKSVANSNHVEITPNTNVNQPLTINQQIAILTPLLDRIVLGEGTSDNKAKEMGFESSYDVPFGYGIYGKPTDSLSTSKISKVQEFQDLLIENQIKAGIDPKKASGAVGRYQITKGTLSDLLKRYGKQLGLSVNSIFNKDTQDKLAYARLQDCGYIGWIGGKSKTKDFQYKMAGIWASIADPDTGMSRYPPQRADTTDAQIKEVMAQTKIAYIAATLPAVKSDFVPPRWQEV